jgi:hypothetical protein
MVYGILLKFLSQMKVPCFAFQAAQGKQGSGLRKKQTAEPQNFEYRMSKGGFAPLLSLR